MEVDGEVGGSNVIVAKVKYRPIRVYDLSAFNE